ncbi:MAG: copper-binding protein [Burkholderiales bacterium]
MNKLKSCLALAVAALGLVLATFAPSAAAQRTAGEVVKVDKAQGKVTLRHEAIPALQLPAMTMAYRVQDARQLERLDAGSKVRFDAEKINGQYTIIRLEAAGR